MAAKGHAIHIHVDIEILIVTQVEFYLCMCSQISNGYTGFTLMW